MTHPGQHSARRLLTTGMLLAPALIPGVELSFQTVGGGSVTGEVLHIEEAVVTIRIDRSTPRMEVSLPLSSIKGVDLAGPSALPDDPAAVLHLGPLFPKAGPALLKALLEGALQLAGREQWMECHRWLEALEEVPFDAPQRTLLRLARARALNGLGLYDALEKELAWLNGHIVPLQAPLELCLLNTEARLREGDLEQALFWAQLPSLRLPARSDPALRALLRALEHRDPASASPPLTDHP